jgi:hypothetical protein
MMAVTTSDGKYHLIIGEQYTSDNYPYVVAERLVNGKYWLFQVDNEEDKYSQQYEVISHMPVGDNPPLDNIPLTVNLSYD